MVNPKERAIDDPQLRKMLPQGQYEYVDATFAAADTDTIIPYSIIKPEDANSVRWIDVTPNVGRVYRAVDPNKTNWGTQYIILRSSAIGSTRLLLFLERE